MKMQIKNSKGEQKKECEGACYIKNLKGWSRKNLRQSKISVELRDDLILPHGGTQVANFDPIIFQKKKKKKLVS